MKLSAFIPLRKLEATSGWQCLECGRKFSKLTRKCPKCGSEDIDIAEGLKEFAPDAKGDSGSGLVMPPEKHELQDAETPKKKCSWCGKSFLNRAGIDSGKCPYCGQNSELQESAWSIGTEPAPGYGKRYVVYNSDTGRMIIMGLGKEGLARAKKFLANQMKESKSGLAAILAKLPKG